MRINLIFKGGNILAIIDTIMLTILTVAIICGVVLIPTPLYRLLNYQKQADRPYLTIEKNNHNSYQITNTGKSEAKIVDIFLSPESKYFEALNDTSFAPGQKIIIEMPNEEKQSKQIEIKYLDSNTNKIFDQIFPLTNL